jgi:phosphoribosylanthranilate isomerase
VPKSIIRIIERLAIDIILYQPKYELRKQLEYVKHRINCQLKSLYLLMIKTTTLVQIYEIQTPYEAEKLIGLGVDHIGSVVLSEAIWKISEIRETIRLSASTQSRSSLILLFNNQDFVFRALDYYQPDIIHFCESLTHSNGTQRDCGKLISMQRKVKAKFPEIKIMRSIPIPQPGLAECVPITQVARLFEPISDYFLTDTLLITPGKSAAIQQPVSGFIGITGQTCDWEAARRLVEASTIPVILAGGISPENVADGLYQVQPAGIDSCTGTNFLDSKGHTVRFKKDFSKVKRLVAKVRQLEQIGKQ